MHSAPAIRQTNLGSEPIGALVTALGSGIGRDDFDIANIRYHWIVVMGIHRRDTYCISR